MSFANLVAKAVTETTKEWAAIKKRQEKDRQAAARMTDRYWRGRSTRTTIKDAAYEVMADAYAKAAGGAGMANARQIMYAARPAIQKLTDESLNDVYFTQNLLPAYMREHPSETAGWDVVYDARGHLTEPHTDHEINLGTIGVRKYLADMKRDPDLKINLPELDSSFPTHGYRNRYGAVLYIEKEGFLPLLESARFAERYDIAIMSSKGMGTTAARDLIGRLCNSVKILVVHDFDKSGFSIAGTLTRNTKRYRRASGVSVIDLGLRLADVEKWDLETENVSHNGDPTANLRANGATVAEIEFLQDQRVELNAFTSDQFVAWLDSKLVEHGVEKVIPDNEILDQAYRRAAAVRRYQAMIDEAREKVATYAKGLTAPQTLRAKVAKRLAKDPTLAWDEAMAVLTGEQERSL
jgi:DNA topoisomerase 6 subunit A-like protein